MGINKDFAIFLRRAHPKASCLKRERRFSVSFFFFFLRRAWGKGDGEDLLCLGMPRNPYIFLSVPIRVDAYTRVAWNVLLFALYGPRNPVALACLDSLNASIISNGFGWVVKTLPCALSAWAVGDAIDWLLYGAFIEKVKALNVTEDIY